jgi:hypothetical protein
MEKNITFKRAIKELDTIIDLSKAEELTKKASKAAEELGFCCVVLDKALIVTNNMGGQTLYTNIKTPLDTPSFSNDFNRTTKRSR